MIFVEIASAQQKPAYFVQFLVESQLGFLAQVGHEGRVAEFANKAQAYIDIYSICRQVFENQIFVF